MNRRWLLPLLVILPLLALIGLFSPDQVLVVGYKLCLLVSGGMSGLFVDIMAAPYAQPSSYLVGKWSWKDFCADGPNRAVAKGCETLFINACYRRAGLVGLGMIVMGLGL